MLKGYGRNRLGVTRVPGGPIVGLAHESMARRLRDARETLGLTQTEMALRLRVKLRAYQSYESAHRFPQADSLEALHGLGISIDWLLTGSWVMWLEQTGKGRIPWDAVLCRQIAEAIAQVYADAGQDVAAAELGGVVVRAYIDLMNAYDDPAERSLGMRLTIEQIRRTLLA